MAENRVGEKYKSPVKLVVLTAILTLLSGGVGAYFLGYLGPGKQAKGVGIAFKVRHPSENQKIHKSSQEKERKVLYWRAPMNPTEIYQNPGKSAMGMDLVPVYEGESPEDPSAIRIDPVIQQNMGIRTAKVKKGPLVRTLRTYGHITPDETLTAQVSPKTNGWIEKLYVDFKGKYVPKGAPLFDLYSPELVAAQEEYLVAFQRSLGGKSMLDSSRRRLQYFDVPESEIHKLEKTGKVSKTMMIRSPLNGFVIEKHAEEGEFIRSGVSVFRIADLSRVWVEVHIYEYELSWVAQGQRAEMTLSYLPGEVFSGKVSYVYPYLQPKTRDLVIRLVFENPDLKLKPDMYADVKIETDAKGEGLIIPSEAVIRSGKKNVVFVTRGEGKFTPRRVKLGLSLDDGYVEVSAGLKAGETIVISGQFLLDSESNLNEAVQKMLNAKVMKDLKKKEEDFFEDMEED